MKAVSAWSCILIIFASNLFAQGPLTPPGPPEPMMKTLDQVEARVPINFDVHDIVEPGSYYLTGNLIGEMGTTGLVVHTSNVTIDLNGFNVTGSTNSTVNNVPGIVVKSNANSVVIYNGTVNLWQDGIVSLGTNLTVRNVQCANNTFDGLRAGAYSQISDCSFINNLSEGVLAGARSRVADVVASGNNFGIVVGEGSLVQNCIAGENVNHGISLSGSGSRVSSCMAEKNNIGISVEGDRCTVDNNTSTDNTSDGIASGILGSTSYTYCRIDNNHVAGNGARGILITGTDNIIVRNVSLNNTLPYFFGPTNMVGTIVSAIDATGVAGSSGGNLDATVGPWSNFAR